MEHCSTLKSLEQRIAQSPEMSLTVDVGWRMQAFGAFGLKRDSGTVEHSRASPLVRTAPDLQLLLPVVRFWIAKRDGERLDNR
jgi:hypothetical protein